jgi:DNA-binding NarL/FixJ family response regulator
MIPSRTNAFMTITIFIADDHAIMREGLTQLLQSEAGFEIVGTAGNGRDAVRQALALRPQVVIMDISMPDMNGIEAARQIHESAPDIRIVILSMHSTAEHVFHALEAGVRGYLLKESAGSDIVNAVHVVLSGRRFLSPKVASIVADQVAQRPGVSPLNSLSKREREILQLVAEGRSSAEIGGILHLSPKTVDTYRSRLMQKLKIGEVAGLVKFAIQYGLTTLE